MPDSFFFSQSSTPVCLVEMKMESETCRACEAFSCTSSHDDSGEKKINEIPKIHTQHPSPFSMEAEPTMCQSISYNWLEDMRTSYVSPITTVSQREPNSACVRMYSCVCVAMRRSGRSAETASHIAVTVSLRLKRWRIYHSRVQRCRCGRSVVAVVVRSVDCRCSSYTRRMRFYAQIRVHRAEDWSRRVCECLRLNSSHSKKDERIYSARARNKSNRSTKIIIYKRDESSVVRGMKKLRGETQAKRNEMKLWVRGSWCSRWRQVERLSTCNWGARDGFLFSFFKVSLLISPVRSRIPLSQQTHCAIIVKQWTWTAINLHVSIDVEFESHSLCCAIGNWHLTSVTPIANAIVFSPLF